MIPEPEASPGRRALLKGLLAAGAGLWLGGCATSSRATQATGSRFLPARLSGLVAADLPAGQRTARNFTACRLDGPGSAPVLTWPGAGGGQTGVRSRLRFTIALDFREERRVEAVLARSGASLGVFDVRYAYAFQPFELALDIAQTEAALREGVVLRPGAGTLPLWIFDMKNRGEGREYFAPHLSLERAPDRKREEFVARLTSYASLQPFGWLEGCVLDGLHDFVRTGAYPRALSALDAHLDHYLDRDGRLISEDLRNRPVENRIPGIEYSLPVATIAAHRPGHPVLDLALEFWNSRRQANDIVCDGSLVSAEGAYTVGHPLAVIAVSTGREDLARLALRQIVSRIELLPEGGDLYLRYSMNGSARTFRNWARAYAWYMLGLVRTWTTLQASAFRDLPGMDTVRTEAGRIVGEVLRFRQPDGLWTCFLDRPETGIDTSGSAGIAAAIAIASTHGLLPASSMAAAREADAALDAWLTPDGLLHGVAQHNAGGEALQTGGYRVISQMGMGLLAQLHAHTRHGRRA